MIVGICFIQLYIPGSRSLKNKRQVVKSLKDKIRLNFNVSIAEVDKLDMWQRADIGITCVSNSKKYIDGVFNKIIASIQKNKSITLLDYSIDMI